MTDTICARCDHDYEIDMIRHYEEGGPARCSHCGLEWGEPTYSCHECHEERLCDDPTEAPCASCGVCGYCASTAGGCGSSEYCERCSVGGAE